MDARAGVRWTVSVFVVGPRNVDVRDERDRRERAAVLTAELAVRALPFDAEHGARIVGDQTNRAHLVRIGGFDRAVERYEQRLWPQAVGGDADAVAVGGQREPFPADRRRR